MLAITQLYIYPVKSLGGLALRQAEITDRGLKHDRRWMLIDENNRFLSQRSHSQMALFELTEADGGFQVKYLPDQTSIIISYTAPLGHLVTVTIWHDECTANLISEELDRWFSQKLGMPCRLVYMADHSHRLVDERFTSNQEVVSFADAYPFLLVGEASLDELNRRLAEKVNMDRFRPNIVFTGAEPYYEDRMAEFKINEIEFFGVKLCARCVMIGVNQQTAETNKEPMKTLAGYRTKNQKVYFGQNLIHRGNGSISIGDTIHILKLKSEFIVTEKAGKYRAV